MRDYIPFIITILILFSFFSFSFYIMYLAKKCNYDCSKCKVFDCPSHYCNRKRKELKK